MIEVKVFTAKGKYLYLKACAPKVRKVKSDVVCIHSECDLNPLAGLADLLENCDMFPYTEIPNFPVTTVPGHVSRMLFGTLNGVTVMLMQGRFHAYEGHPLGVVSYFSN